MSTPWTNPYTTSLVQHILLANGEGSNERTGLIVGEKMRNIIRQYLSYTNECRASECPTEFTSTL